MRQIETNHAAPRMTSPRDSRHIECLPCRIIHSAQQDQCYLISRTLDHSLNLFIAKARLAWRAESTRSAKSQDQSHEMNLRFHCVLIRRERTPLHKNFVSAPS